jgi:two-component system cell cycle response regulator CpdR
MASKQTLHILLVENESFVMEVTTLVLERLGYIVHGETNGLEALSTFSDNPDTFDLAIIEPLMPRMGGLEFAIRLRRIRNDLPVLFYAGYLDPSLEQEISKSGVGQTIFKPLYSRELSEAIQERLSLASPHIC